MLHWYQIGYLARTSSFFCDLLFGAKYGDKSPSTESFTNVHIGVSVYVYTYIQASVGVGY